jgi:hypothetical protein
MKTTGTASFIFGAMITIAAVTMADKAPIVEMTIPAPSVQAASLQPATEAAREDLQKAFDRAYQKTMTGVEAPVLCPSCIPPCPPICP